MATVAELLLLLLSLYISLVCRAAILASDPLGDHRLFQDNDGKAAHIQRGEMKANTRTHACRQSSRHKRQTWTQPLRTCCWARSLHVFELVRNEHDDVACSFAMMTLLSVWIRFTRPMFSSHCSSFIPSPNTLAGWAYHFPLPNPSFRPFQ